MIKKKRSNNKLQANYEIITFLLNTSFSNFCLKWHLISFYPSITFFDSSDHTDDLTEADMVLTCWNSICFISRTAAATATIKSIQPHLLDAVCIFHDLTSKWEHFRWLSSNVWLNSLMLPMNSMTIRYQCNQKLDLVSWQTAAYCRIVSCCNWIWCNNNCSFVDLELNSAQSNLSPETIWLEKYCYSSTKGFYHTNDWFLCNLIEMIII